MNHFNQISAEYKKGFIDDVLNGMTPLLDNVQLRELNRVLNYHTSQLDFGEGLIDTNSDYEVQNKKLLVQYIKSKKVEGLSNRTIDYYEHTLKKLEELTVKSFINLTHTDIMEFLVFYQELNQCSKISIDNIRRIFYGSFKDIRQADRMVELLKENDWDINKRDELKEQVLGEWNCRK